MNRKRRRVLQAVILPAIVFVGSVVADDFEVARSTIDGGGTMRAAGGDFELSGTIGQPDAGVMSGGSFTLTGGFWFPVAPGDGNEDGAVDLTDFDVFNACLLGPVGGLGSGCDHYDSDGNGHIDMRDYAAFQLSFTGSP